MLIISMKLREFLLSSLSDAVVLVSLVGIGITIHSLTSWLTSRAQLEELWELTGLCKSG